MPSKINLKNSPLDKKLRRDAAEALIRLTASAEPPLIGDTLKTRRQSLGISNESLAVAMSIAGSSLRNYESGGRMALDPEALDTYMQLLRVDFPQLLVLYRNSRAKRTQAHLQ